MAVVVCGVVWAGVASEAWAIPAFARRYEVACHFCHEGYPKLNGMGQRFRERGFRMEKEEAFDFDQWLRTVPVALRAQGTHFFREGEDDETVGTFKGVAAGSLGGRVAFWIDDVLFVDEDGTDHLGVDNGWLRLDFVKQGRLYARGGRIELDIPFTQTRTPHLFPYEIYFANTGFESDNIADHHYGGEVGGFASGGWHWSAAVVDGINPERADEIDEDAGKFDGNVFLRLSKRVDAQRLGAFAYFGRNTLTQPTGLAWKNNLLRLGADASLWIQRFNLYGVLMYGRNDNAIATSTRPEGTGEEESFTGGFLQGDLHLRPEVALTLRFDVVRQPVTLVTQSSSEKETFTSLSPGMQVWVRERLKLSFEYGFRNQDRPGRGAVQAEVAF